MSLTDVLIRTRLLLDDVALVVRAGLLADRNGRRPGRPMKLDALEDRVHFDAMPLVAVAADAVADVAADQQAVVQAPPDEIDAAVPDAGEIRQAQPDLRFDGAPVGQAPADEMAADLAGTSPIGQAPPDLRSISTARELAFVDPGVADYQQLIDDLTAGRPDRQIDVVLLDVRDDGIAQITAALADYDQLDAVHFLTHGTAGAVKLGGTWLDLENLDAYAGEIAKWNLSLGRNADLLFYGCDLAADADGQALVEALGGLTGADVAASVDATGHADFGADWDLEFTAGSTEAAVALSDGVQQDWFHLLAASSPGTAIWVQNGVNSPQLNDWDGTAFTGESSSANVGEWRIVQGAEAPTRDEIIVLGVEDGTGAIAGQMWNGSSWNALPINPLGTVSQTYWWSVDIAYESQSGHALMVWADGANVEYATWDGTAWSTVNTVAIYSGATPRQMQLAASPNADEMVLVVSDSNSQDTAYVWNGTSWGNPVTLATNSSDDRTDIYVAYEQQSGDAMVVFGDNNADPKYRIWDGASWSGATVVARPAGATGAVRWTTLASDPNSDRIALGVTTRNSEVWLSVWDGAAWGSAILAGTQASTQVAPNVAVAFESASGDALAAYGRNLSDVVRYRTWTSSGGWSSEQNVTSLGNTPNSMTLSSDPAGDHIMLSVQDDNSDVHYIQWDGAVNSWGVDNVLETNSGETKNQPFLFLWDQTLASPNNPPTVALSNVVTALSENYNTAPGVKMADVVITDDGAGTNDLSLSGDDAGLFEILGSELWLKAGAALDHETNPALDVTVEVDDTAVGATPDDTASLATTISDVNEAPVNSVPGVQTTPQDIALLFTVANGNSVSVSDVDAASGQMEMTLAATNGTVTLGWPSGTAAVVGGEFRINATTSDGQATLDRGFYGRTTGDFGGPRAVACDPSGNFVVTWSSKNQDGDGWGIYARQYDDAGVAQGGEFLVNTTTTKDQVHSSVAMDDAGNFVIVWASKDQDGDKWGIYAQRYDATGTAQGSEFLVNTVTSKEQLGPSIAMDGAGDFVVTWSSKDQDGDNWGVYAKRFDAVGVAEGGEFRVSNTTTKEQTASSVAMDADGDFVIGWSSKDQDGDQWGVYAKRFNAAGVPQGGEFLVNTMTAKEQQFSSVAMDGDGNFMITWSSKDQDGDNWGVYAKRYDATGVVQGGEFQVNVNPTKEQMHSSVAMDADGDFVITWSAKDQDGDKFGVYARQYTASGIAKGGETLVNTTAAGEQGYSSVAMDARGDFFVVWSGNGPGDDRGVFGQRFAVPTGLTFITGDGTRDATTTFQGTLADVNAMLDGLVFMPNASFNGLATITMTTDDLGNTGSGGPQSDADTIDINVGNGNVAPTVTLTGGVLNYTENDPATPIDPTASVSDPDSSDFDGGQLSVLLSGNGTANDRLAIRNEGTAVGQIGVAGGNVTYNFGAGAVVIGSFSGGTDAVTPLVVTPNANATTTAVETLVRNITYENVSDDPSTLTRTVQFSLTDGDGGTDTQAISVTVTGLNDAPVLTAIAPNLIGTDEDTPSVAQTVASFVGASISDVDAGAQEGIAITAASGNGTWMYRLGGIGPWLPFGALSQNAALLLRDVDEVRYVPDTVGGETATITYRAWDQTGATAGQQGNKMDASSTGGTEPFSTAQDTGSLVVADVNDAPQLDLDADDSAGRPGGDFAANFLEDGGPVLAADADASLSDVDNATLQSLTVTITNLLDGAAESLSADTSGTGIAASYDSATGVLMLSGSDTLANYAQVLRTVAYDNSSQDPDANARVITFVANDGADTSSPATTTLSVGPQNDPPAVSNQAFGIQENLPNGTSVGTIAFTDPDAADTHTFAVLGGTGATAFGVHPTTGEITVADSSQLDYETTTAFTLQVQVTDDAAPNLSDTATITISLTDQDEFDVGPVVDIDAAANSVSESAANGTAVGVTAAATDGDATDTVAYSLDDDAGGRFQIGSATGVVTVKDNTLLDYETATSHAIIVRATSTDGSTSTASFTIDLADQNDTAPVIAPGQIVSVAEDAGAGASVGTVVATDADTVGSLQNWTITGGDPDGVFAVDSNSGQIVVADNTNLDFETTPAYTLTLTVSDGANMSNPATITVAVGNVNEPPASSVPAPQVTDEDTPLVFSSASGNAITISDVDAATNPVIVTISTTNGTLTLGSTSGLTFGTGDGVADATMTFVGTLAEINNALDGLRFDPAANYHGPATIQITVDDQGNVGSGGSKTDLDTIDITVVPVNDAPTATGQTYSVVATETLSVAAPGVLAGDADLEGDPLTAQLVSGPVHGTLTLQPDGSFRYTPDGAFVGTDSFTYQAQDGSAASSASTVVITVTDPPLAPPEASPEVPPEGEGNDEPQEESDDDDETGIDLPEALPPQVLPDVEPRAAQTESAPKETVGIELYVVRPAMRQEPTEAQSDTAAGTHADGGSQGEHSKVSRSPWEPARAAGGSEPAEPDPYEAFTQAGGLWTELNELDGQMQSNLDFHGIVVGSAALTSAGLTVGYVLWMLRGGMLLSSLLAQMPAWLNVDPLVVLDQVDGKRQGRSRPGSESLESIIEEARRRSHALEEDSRSK